VHGCRAGAAWKPELAFEAACAAAREAASIYAIESAVTYFELAQTVRRWCVSDAPRDLEFLVAFGDALTRAGDRNQARPVLDEAITLARRADDLQALARIALVIGLGTETAGVPDRGAWRLLDEVLAKLPPDEHQLRSRLLARAAWQALSASEGERLRAAAEAAVTEARMSGDPGTIAQALNAYFISTAERELPFRRQIAREITSHASLADDIDLLFSGLLWEAHIAMEMGDIGAAREAARRYRETAERWPMPYHAWYRGILETAFAFLDDRLDDAATTLDQLDPAMTPQPEYASLLHVTQRMELAARRGDRDGFESAATDLLAYLEHTPIYPSVRAHIDACLGRQNSALEALDQFMAMLNEGPRDNDWLAELTEGALAAIRLGARAQAEPLFKHLMPYQHHWTVLANATVSRGPVAGVLAGLARLRGDVAGAIAFETEARAAVRREGTPGALIWMDGGPHWAPAETLPGRPAGLSRRELEVLSLIAAGCSNQEIADRLVLSIRTVQRHVENIYAKTGARGRAAASVFAATHGLIAAGF
jgi:ATP/maltotriose-dependent transcriptional regulator MalT